MMSTNEIKLSIDEERAKARRMNQIRTYLPVVGLVAVFVLFIFLTNGAMIAPRNLILLLNQVYVVMIAAMGVFFIMTMGGLDFSQGSILGISSIVICILSPHGIGLAILGGIAAGAVIGAINAYFHVCRKIASFIVTICTMFLFRGFIKYFASDSPVRASMDVYDYDSIEFKLACTVLIVLVGVIVTRETVGDGLRLNGGQNDVLGIGDNDRAGTSAAGDVDDTVILFRILHKAFDRCGIGPRDGDDPPRRHHIAEADIDKFHILSPFRRNAAIVIRYSAPARGSFQTRP